jgi:predicted amidohydrolase YtcJ
VNQEDAPGRLLLREVRLGLGGPVTNVLIDEGRIAAITGDLPSGPFDEVVDAGGRLLLPGFWDAHVHMTQWASARRRVDLSGASSAREAAALMAAAHERSPEPDEPLVGFGFRDGLWPDQPDPALLAWAPPERPVMLVSNDLHTTWLSWAGLYALGIADHPTGLLREKESLDAVARLDRAGQETTDRWITEALTAAAARGIVGFLDFEYADNVAEWRRRASRRRLATRVACAIYPQYLDDAVREGLRTGTTLPGSDGQVETGPLKIFADGSLNARTALCADPYPATPAMEGGHGVMETPPDELVRLMARASGHGIHPAVHAIGDRANSIALDAFEHVGCPGRIEHAQLVDRRDQPRFARPGLVLGIQPAHAADDRDVADRYWAGRTGRAFAYADLLRAGAVLQIGSDAPVAPMDPWPGIAAAVHRTKDERDPWHPEQAIGLADALRAACRGRPTPRVGDAADLVLVERDPAGLGPRELSEMPVFGTLLAGRWTYRSS